MPRIIVRLDDWYLEWSTVVDAPVSYGMTRTAAFEFIRGQTGSAVEARNRLERVDRFGTSMLPEGSLTASDVIGGNRAGDDDTELTRDEIIRVYCTEQDSQGDAA